MDRGVSDTGHLREYLRLRSTYQDLFPGNFLAIREQVERNLAEFETRGVVGELDRETALARDPSAGLAAPYDWVAFGFGGFEFYDAHVGVVIDTGTWPCTCHVGFHRRAHLPAETHRAVEQIDWAAAVGAIPQHVLVESTHEHQLRDEPRAFGFTDVDGEITHFATRAIAYYRAAAPALAPAHDADTP